MRRVYTDCIYGVTIDRQEYESDARVYALMECAVHPGWLERAKIAARVLWPGRVRILFAGERRDIADSFRAYAAAIEGGE